WAWTVALAVLLLALGAGVTTVQAAQRALPGSPLYPVKRWSEAARLYLTHDPTRRTALLLTFAENRVQEARLLLQQGRTEQAEQALADLDAYLAQLARQSPQAAGDLPPEVAALEERLNAELLTTAALAPPPLREDLLQVINGWAAQHAQALLHRADDLTFFVGPVDDIQGQVWRVGGRTVYMTEETLIYGVPREGDLVEILGHENADGSWTALEVRIAARRRAQQSAQVEFVGRLERRGPSTWQVNGLELTVAPQADIVGDPQEGEWVEVAAVWDARVQQWILWHAEPVERMYGVEVEFSGPLTAQEGDIWWVAGLPVRVTDLTKTVGPQPQVGDLVVVHAWRQVDGSLLAEEIHVVAAGTAEPDQDAPQP
ncbi:MAG: hypothetical protein GXO37_06425, partial [Chloroflexi bacterium]|nr:hypothetical protein [Chloroflexota bacterium]